MVLRALRFWTLAVGPTPPEAGTLIASAAVVLPSKVSVKVSFSDPVVTVSFCDSVAPSDCGLSMTSWPCCTTMAPPKLLA